MLIMMSCRIPLLVIALEANRKQLRTCRKQETSEASSVSRRLSKPPFWTTTSDQHLVSSLQVPLYIRSTPQATIEWKRRRLVIMNPSPNPNFALLVRWYDNSRAETKAELLAEMRTVRIVAWQTSRRLLTSARFAYRLRSAGKRGKDALMTPASFGTIDQSAERVLIHGSSASFRHSYLLHWLPYTVCLCEVTWMCLPRIEAWPLSSETRWYGYLAGVGSVCDRQRLR